MSDYDYPEEKIIPTCGIMVCRGYDLYGYLAGWKFMLHPDADMSYRGPRDEEGNLPDYSSGALLAGDPSCCCWYWQVCYPDRLTATTAFEYDPTADLPVSACGYSCDYYKAYMYGTYRRNSICWADETCVGNLPYPEDLFPFEDINKIENSSCRDDCWNGTEYVPSVGCATECRYSWSMSTVPLNLGMDQFSYSIPNAGWCAQLTFDGRAMDAAFPDTLVVGVREEKTKVCIEYGCWTDDTGTYPISYPYYKSCTAVRARARIFALPCQSSLDPTPVEVEGQDITSQFLIQIDKSTPEGYECIEIADNEYVRIRREAIWTWWWWWWHPIDFPVPGDPLATCDDVDLPDFWGGLPKTCSPCYSQGSPFCRHYWYYRF